ncbi:MAG: TonB family protein [Gemmatimonadota bacterium]
MASVESAPGDSDTGSLASTVAPGAPIVYLADRDVLYRMRLARALEERGAEVVEFDGGVGLYAQALRRAPDLIVMETELDEMNGFETFDRLQRHRFAKPFCIVFLTRFEHLLVAETCRERGARDYLGKARPFHEVVESLVSWLPARALNPSARAGDAQPLRALSEGTAAAPDPGSPLEAQLSRSAPARPVWRSSGRRALAALQGSLPIRKADERSAPLRYRELAWAGIAAAILLALTSVTAGLLRGCLPTGLPRVAGGFLIPHCEARAAEPRLRTAGRAEGGGRPLQKPVTAAEAMSAQESAPAGEGAAAPAVTLGADAPQGAPAPATLASAGASRLAGTEPPREAGQQVEPQPTAESAPLDPIREALARAVAASQGDSRRADAPATAPASEGPGVERVTGEAGAPRQPETAELAAAGPASLGVSEARRDEAGGPLREAATPAPPGGSPVPAPDDEPADYSLSAIRRGPQFVPVSSRPLLSKRLQVQYPRALAERKIGGTVTFWVLVNAAGEVEDVRVLRSSGQPELDVAALRAVRSASYVAARREEAAVPTWTQQQVVFRLD